MDLLARLHERLVTALAAVPASAADGPVTIGDIYQRLIPYRLMRTELGVMELAAYEHALLRLLAGEGGYVEITSSDALNEISRELASVNPILGIYRDYAEVVVALRMNAVRGPSPAEKVPAEPIAVATAEESRAAEKRRAAEADSCTHCGQTLPFLAGLRFCPFCGQIRPPKPCVRCATPLEADWNFCIRCGTSVEQASRK